MTTMPDSVMLALPSEWDDIPIEAGQHRRYVARQLEHLREMGDVSRTDMRKIEIMGAMFRRLAEQQRVLSVSNYLAVERGETGDAGDENDAGDEEEDSSPTVVMAGLAVSALRRRDLGTDVPLMAEVMVRAFSAGAPSDDNQARFVEIEPPTVCTVGEHQAAKLVRLMVSPDGRGREFKQFTQSYLVSVANGDAVVALQFSTINFEYARQFSELFERIAQTLRILYPDDPTFLDEEPETMNAT